MHRPRHKRDACTAPTSVRKDGSLDAALVVELQKLAAHGVNLVDVKSSDKTSMHAQHGDDNRNPYAFFRASYHAQNPWICFNKDPRIEKPSSLQPVESSAIVHTLNIGALEALQGATLFPLKDFQARFVCVHAFSGMR